ncbi:MAG: hypothetical protein LCH77_10060 [Actinobacteria bacterium]|uniref:hypothetical protein n=1 Tax=Nostocoides veronense TaxID=330836 RepID=UPI0031CEB941|nr:hypothetical protein [Actinomycetota bacterium]
MREAAREVGRIVRDAARLLLRHWPALLTLGLLGAAWRSGTLWLAVIVSNRSGPLAQLLLALAPVGYLLAIVAMLRVVRPSLSPPKRPLTELPRTSSPTVAECTKGAEATLSAGKT